MANRLFLILFLWLSAWSLQAAVVTLHSGKKLEGEILVNNEQVLIIHDLHGARFQIPAAQVVEITEKKQTETATIQQEEIKKPQGRKTSIFFALTGGGTLIPQEKGGGTIGGEVFLGSRYLGTKPIFLGGGVGVNALFANGQSYLFIPVQLAVKVPFIDGKHAPYVGAAIGYGFGTRKNYKGGIFTSVEVGYRYNINKRSALFLGFRTQFQQATIDGKITVAANQTETTYTDHAGRSLVTLGIHLGIAF